VYTNNNLNKMTRIYEVNEHFFDQESRVMWYILGISFAKCRRVKEGEIRWQSSSKPLLEIVRSSIDSECSVKSRDYAREGEDDFVTYRLCISSSNMRRALIDRDLDVPKKERIFPKDIEEQYLDHFVRGIFDAQVTCQNTLQLKKYGDIEYAYHYQRLIIGQFNTEFLQDLYDALVEHAHIKGGKSVSEPPLGLFRRSDVSAICSFLYRDENGLYLASKKELFEVKYDIENHPKEPYRDGADRHNFAMDLLSGGMSIVDVAGELGFRSPVSFSNGFKLVVGKSPSEIKPKQ